MYRAISESLHKELTKRDDFNKIDFLMKLRKAVNKNDTK